MPCLSIIDAFPNRKLFSFQKVLPKLGVSPPATGAQRLAVPGAAPLLHAQLGVLLGVQRALEVGGRSLFPMRATNSNSHSLAWYKARILDTREGSRQFGMSVEESVYVDRERAQQI